MKTLFLAGPQRFEYVEADPLEAPAGWVRVRVRHVGICGSDVHYYTEGRIGDQVVEYPFVIGHECSGEVLEGGGFEPGAPVYVEPAIPCGKCDQCQAGGDNRCRNIKFFGTPDQAPGCMQEVVVMPPENIFPLPEGVTREEGLLLEPLCIGVYCVLQSRFPKGGTAAVLGAGPIGLSVLLGLSDFEPVAVYVSEPVAYRREAASALGATATFDPDPVEQGAWQQVQDASQRGVDVAFECVGSQEAIDDAVLMLKPGGVLMLVGIPETLDYVKFNPNICRRRELTLINVRRQNHAIGRALPLLERRRDFKDILITHRFTPDQATQAFDLVHERKDGVIKAVISF